MVISIGELNKDNSIDLEKLFDLIDLCKKKGYWLLKILDNNGYARAIILNLKSPGKGELFERLPVHGVGITTKLKDSYDSLISILEKGFKGTGDINASINILETKSFLIQIASGKKASIWGDSSNKQETSGDRYFIEFKKFFSDEWERGGPRFLGDWLHMTVDRANTSDLIVNVILGTTDSTEIKKRIKMYKQLFSSYKVKEYYFITADGLI